MPLVTKRQCSATGVLNNVHAYRITVETKPSEDADWEQVRQETPDFGVRGFKRFDHLLTKAITRPNARENST